jgi:heme exporter protein A
MEDRMSAIPLSIHAAAVASAAAVEAIGLGKSIDDRPILEDLNFTIAPGSFVALLGANGAGKSTLLKILATLSPPTAGQLLLFGAKLDREAIKARSRIGLIGHQSMLYRDLTARENLRFFGKLYGVKDLNHRIDELLEAMDLSDRGDDAVKTFSRGMTQRVAIARALIHSPDLLLADEPFDGLDAPSINALEQNLARLHASGKTIILTNHNIEQSLRLTQRTLVLRQGWLVLDETSSQLDSQVVLKEMERP